MKKTITFISLLFFLASCANPAPEPVTTVIPTQTQKPIPTATATPQPELTVVDEKAEIGAIYDENGDPKYVLQNDVLVAAELNAYGLLQTKASDNRVVIWDFEKKEWESAISMSDMDLTEIYGASDYRYNSETGALEVRDSKGKWSEAITVNKDGTLLIHTDTEEGDVVFERSALAKTEINIVGTKYLMTVDSPEAGAVGKFMFVKELGMFVAPIERSSMIGDWTQFKTADLESDFGSGKYAMSMGLQIPDSLKVAKPITLYWSTLRLGGGIMFEENYFGGGGGIQPGSMEDGAMPAFDTRQVLNPQTGEMFPVETMVIKLAEGGPYLVVSRNRDGFWKVSNGESTSLERVVLNKPGSLDARDGILLATSGPCDVYKYYPGADTSTLEDACNLSGNQHITITTANGDPFSVWVLDSNLVSVKLAEYLLRDLKLTKEISKPLELNEYNLKILAQLQLMPVPPAK